MYTVYCRAAHGCAWWAHKRGLTLSEAARTAADLMMSGRDATFVIDLTLRPA